jgi:NAD dependent epimerase/dehydratase
VSPFDFNSNPDNDEQPHEHAEEQAPRPLLSYLAGQRVLVTGAGGFIGSHLVEALIGLGCRVRAMVRYNARNDIGHLASLAPENRELIEIIAGDLTDPYFMRQVVRGCETVFHLASLIGIPYSYTAAHQYVLTNVQGGINLLEACRGEGVGKIVVTSTSEAYGTALYTPMDEAHPLQAQSPYAASKIAMDKLAESYYRSFGLPVTTIRPFNAYGPRQSSRAILPTLITQALAIKQGKARAFKVGSVTPIRDFTYVTDTVNGFLRIAASPDTIGEVINIGNGSGISIQACLEKIVSIVDLPDVAIEVEPHRVRPENSEVKLLLCDRSKARKILQWEPMIDFDHGLRLMIQSFSEIIGGGLNPKTPSSSSDYVV